MDPLGRIGYFGQHFLGCSRPWLPSTKPLWLPSDMLGCPASHQAYLNSSQSPANLLPTPDAFLTSNHPKELFGSTYHTPIPRLWCQQSFGLTSSMPLRANYSPLFCLQATPSYTLPEFGPDVPSNPISHTPQLTHFAL